MIIDLLEKALLEEDLSIAEELIEEHQKATEEREVIEWELDDLMVRKLLIKAKLVKAEIQRKKDMRDVIWAEWNQMIGKLEYQVKSIEDLVNSYISIDRSGQSLQLDVATASLRKVKHNFSVSDKQTFENYLIENDLRDTHLKSPEIDFTSAKNAILNQLTELYPDGIPFDIIQEIKSYGLEYKPEHKSLSIRYN